MIINYLVAISTVDFAGKNYYPCLQYYDIFEKSAKHKFYDPDNNSYFQICKKKYFAIHSGVSYYNVLQNICAW